MNIPLVLTVFGPPVTKKNSSRIVGRGPRCRACGGTRYHSLLPSEAYMQWAKSAVIHGPPGLALPLPDAEYNLSAVFYRAKRIGDLGNYLAALCDLLEERGIVSNDKWLSRFDGSRLEHDKVVPRIELVITPVVRDE